MKVILHTGWRKTGTSAIQHFLYSNRARLRERHSILYPETGLFGRAHHLAGWKLLGRGARGWASRGGRSSSFQREGGFAEMIREAADSGCRALVASSEVLSQPGILEKLQEALRGHEVEVISYVRRQDRYIEARYNQRVKDGRLTIGLEEFAARQADGDGLDYHEHFRRWAGAFGREAVKIRLYERERFPRGDVRLDFLDAIGLGPEGLDFEEGMRNASLNFAGVEFLRRFNSVSRNRIRRRYLLRLLDEFDAGPRGHTSLFAPQARRDLVERFREPNRRLAREFLGADSVFEMSDAEMEKESRLARDYGEEQFLEMLAFVVPRLLARKGAGLGAPARKGRKAAGKAPKARKKQRGRPAPR